jgi:hypothetical protein
MTKRHPIRWLLSLCFAITLGGCATRFSQGTQSVTQLDLGKGPTSGRYQLIDDSHRLIATADATSHGLTFELPGKYHIDDCVAVIDPKRKSATAQPFLFLSLRSEYQQLLAQRNAAASTDAIAARRAADLRQQLQAAQTRLANNRAYVNQACEAPTPDPLPPLPQPSCGPENECSQQGLKECTTAYLLERACGAVAGKLDVPSLLSSPACAKAIASSKGEDYAIDKAIVDGLLGLSEDYATELQQSEDQGSQAAGTFWKFLLRSKELLDVAQCQNDFVEAQYRQPFREWQAEADRVRAEPAQALSDCQTDTNSITPLSVQITDVDSQRRTLQSQLQSLDAKMREIASAHIPIQWCVARQ